MSLTRLPAERRGPPGGSTAPKPPPENPEAEASLLGAVLLDARVYEELVRGRIGPADLSREQHRIVLRTIEAVAGRGETIGFASVQGELQRSDELAAVGGPQFLVGLMQDVPTVAHTETYVTIVERTALLRRLIGTANEIARIALVRDEANAAVEEAQRLLFGVSEATLHRDIVPLDLALRRYADQITARGDEQAAGIPTGLTTLDAKTGGLQASDLIILAGRPGLGKTSLALCIVEHAALFTGKVTAMFSLEMSEMQVVQRLVSMNAQIDGTRIRRGRLTLDELQAINDASARLQQAPVFVEESTRLTVTDILAKARRLQAERGLDLVVIDYLQLIEGADDEQNRVQEVAKISRSLKAVARELQVPVVALSQLSRQIETRGTEPMLSDLRECVTGDTRVVDAQSGRWIPVRQVKAGMSLLALDEDEKIRKFEVADAWSTGKKPIFRVTSQTGRTIRATRNHPFLTPTGWKALGDLRVGDRIATARRLPTHGVERRDREDRCRLLGYLVGDGTYRTHRAVGFISHEDESFWDVVRLVEGEWPGVTHRMKSGDYYEADFARLYPNGYGKPHGNPLREWLRAVGVEGERDCEKRVADYVFEAGAVGARAFLSGYLQTDGCVKWTRTPRGTLRWSVQFDSTSRRLLLDVQALLLRLGIVASIGKGQFNTKSTMPIYRLQVNQVATNLAGFVHEVPTEGQKGRLLIQMWAGLPRRETSPGVFALPSELSSHLATLDRGWRDQGKMMRRSTAMTYAERTGDARLRRAAESDVLWEKIRAIEPAGEEEVFDLRVPGSGNFMADGFIVHNSGALEQDADLVLFLWQKDVQDRRDGVVRLKLAKHRNGPTADIDLHFEREITRFRDLGETHATS